MSRCLLSLFFCVFTGLLLAACGGRSVKCDFSGSPYVDPGRMEKDEIVHLPTGTRLTQAELFDLLAASRVVFVGEGHDNIYDHQVELKVIRALARRRPGKVAVGFEMLAAGNQEKIDAWRSGRLSDDDFIRLFAENWGVYDYIYYREIFAFLKREQIPVYGLNVSRRRKMAFMRQLLREEAGASRNEASDPCPDPYQEEALRAMFAGHAGGHGDFRVFLAVQRLWEETMAGTVATVLSAPAHRDWTLVVISGEFHVARGYGLPRRVFRRLKLPYATLLTTTPPELYENRPETMEVDFPSLPLYLCDYLWCVPYRNLKERQPRLGVELKKAAAGPGLEVVTVEEDSAAARAGLRVGDLLLYCNGHPLTGDPLGLSLLLLRHQPGDEVKIELRRGERRFCLEVKL